MKIPVMVQGFGSVGRGQPSAPIGGQTGRRIRVGDLLNAEINEKQARSIKYQLTIAKLPLAKDLEDFQFEGTPINTLLNDLAGGGFIAQQRNAVPCSTWGSTWRITLPPSSTNKIALFIDGANFYSTAKALGFDIDFKSLLNQFQSGGTLVRAFYYTAIFEEEYSSLRPLVDWLNYNGYTVVDQGNEGIRRCCWPPENEGQHGHRARGRCLGTRGSRRRNGAVLG
jgi:hypothetical protein